MSLHSKVHWRGDVVPGVSGSDWFPNTVFILVSFEAIMLTKVTTFITCYHDERVLNVEFKSTHAKNDINCNTNQDMKNKVTDHDILQDHADSARFGSFLLILSASLAHEFVCVPMMDLKTPMNGLVPTGAKIGSSLVETSL